jgi:hypothetical protein
MNRRDALSRVALLMGGTLSAPTMAAFLGGCTNSAAEKTAALQAFTPEVLALLAEVTETIIPKTDTPGAKDAKVAEFIQLMLTDCYAENDRKRFFNGLEDIQNKSQKAYQKSFVELKPEERIAVFKDFEKEAFERHTVFKTAQDKKNKAYVENFRKGVQTPAKESDPKEKPEEDHPYFLLKSLTLFGYFTSEPGATKALEYVAVPGKFEGVTEYKPGQKAWAM